MNIYTKDEIIARKASIIKKEKEDLLIDDPFVGFANFETSMMKTELDGYISRENNTRQHLSNCFNNTIKFLSGGEDQLVFLGIVSDQKGFLKKEFEIKANISFYEELKLTIFTKNALKIIIYFFDGLVEIFWLLTSVILNFFNIFDINTILYHYFKESIDKTNKNFIDLFKIDLENDRILVYHSYDDLVVNSEKYPYKAVDNNLDDKLNMICDYVTVKTKNLFFNDVLYTTWESKLTKDELTIMRKYRLLYGNNYHQYIKLFERLYEVNCDKEIKNKEGFKKKYVGLILAMHNSNMLNETDKQAIRNIHLKYEQMKINKGENLNERKKRRK